jgi:rRNA biogenesis protein RRP5
MIQWKVYRFASTIEFGTIYSDAEILHVDRCKGVFVRLPQIEMAHAHISRLMDEKVESPEKKFKVGETYPCRIIGLDYCNGMVHLSFQKSILTQPFLRYEDIHIGQRVKGHILRLDNTYGMLVSLSETIRGLCPISHLADLGLKNPQKKFKIGALITCRVLSVDPSNKKLLLTHKKTLVESNLEPILTSYEFAKKNSIVHGYISKVQEFGCIVKFYGDVRGFVPSDDYLDKEKKENYHSPHEFFKVGQVVMCRVVSVNPKYKRLRLSFNLALDSSETNQKKEDHVIDRPTDAKAMVIKDLKVTTGSKKQVSCSSQRGLLFPYSPESLAIKNLDDVSVGMLVEGFIKTTTTTKGCFISISPNLTARVKICELSDAFIREEELAEKFPPGQCVKGRILTVDKAQKHIEMTLKMSLVDPDKAKRRLLLDDLKVDMIVTGRVKKIEKYGIFVKLDDSNVSGLCHISEVRYDGSYYNFAP